MKKTLPINRNSLFRRLYSKGKTASSFDIVVYTLPNRAGGNRVGITVSTKVGPAVIRNRVRRRIKEAYRTLEGNIPGGINMVIVARSASVNRTMPQIRALLKELLKKNAVWVDE